MEIPSSSFEAIGFCLLSIETSDNQYKICEVYVNVSDSDSDSQISVYKNDVLIDVSNDDIDVSEIDFNIDVSDIDISDIEMSGIMSTYFIEKETERERERETCCDTICNKKIILHNEKEFISEPCDNISFLLREVFLSFITEETAFLCDLFL
jgi:hypothetical protein